MAARPDYYEVLGITNKAKLTDVTRAYNRWVAEFGKETTAPDPKRESLLREAFEVLSDDDRRDAYDKALSRQRSPGRKSGAPVVAIAVVVLAAAGAGAFFVSRSSAPPAAKAKTSDELQFAMSGSVSPIVTFDVSGKVAPAGLAFVIENKVMVANCKDLPPGVQLMVNAGTKPVAARVTMADDKLGLCKILTDSYVGEPLAVNSVTPAVGAKVYAASLGAKGEVGLREARITKVVDEPAGMAIQSSFAAQEGGNGGPLLDAQGKVVAVATLQADGNTIHRVIPAGWLAENRPKVVEPRPYQGAGSSSSSGSASAASGAAPGTRYAPPAASYDYGCDCDFENDPQWQAEREAKWKRISELPPAERERAAKAELMVEESTRKTMKEMNERFRGK